MAYLLMYARVVSLPLRGRPLGYGLYSCKSSQSALETRMLILLFHNKQQTNYYHRQEIALSGPAFAASSCLGVHLPFSSLPFAEGWGGVPLCSFPLQRGGVGSPF